MSIAALAGYRHLCSAVAGPFLTLLEQALEALLFPCRGAIPGSVGSFQLGGVFTGWKALTIESSIMKLGMVNVMNPNTLCQTSLSLTFQC